MKVKLAFELLTIVLIISHYQGFCQNIVRIYLPEYNYTLAVSGKSLGTYSITLPDNRKIDIDLFDYRGRMDVKCYDKNSKLVEKGSYVNSLCLLKKYIRSLTSDKKDIAKQKVSIGIYSYYQPLRNGSWFFYDEYQRLHMKKKYEKGILIDSLVFNGR